VVEGLSGVTVDTATVRLNIGCGDLPMRNTAAGWLNIDERPNPGVDVVMRVPPLRWADHTVSEIYAGHFLEHLDQAEGRFFLEECHRVLETGGTVGILVPDMAEIFYRYVSDRPAPMELPAGHHRDLRDLDDLCEVVLFSTVQPSEHRWAYDRVTLKRALERAGFVEVTEFDRFTDPRVAVGAWYQIGLEARKP
jgi:predicted SAM-dependent methyltransferase